MARFFLFATSSLARLSVHSAWVSLIHQGGWMKAFCREFVEWVCLRDRRFDITSLSGLSYYRYWGFGLGWLPGFCRLKITEGGGEWGWSLPCNARVSIHVHGASLGDTSARSMVLPVSPCRTPRCVGTCCWHRNKEDVTKCFLSCKSLLAAALFIPQTRSCIEITSYHDCVSQFVFHLLKEITTLFYGAGGGARVYIDQNMGFVSLIWHFLCACGTHIQVKGGYCFAEIASNNYCPTTVSVPLNDCEVLKH